MREFRLRRCEDRSWTVDAFLFCSEPCEIMDELVVDGEFSPSVGVTLPHTLVHRRRGGVSFSTDMSKLHVIASVPGPPRTHLCDCHSSLTRGVWFAWSVIRFLVSPQGLKVVLEKFSKADFGRCPR